MLIISAVCRVASVRVFEMHAVPALIATWQMLPACWVAVNARIKLCDNVWWSRKQTEVVSTYQVGVACHQGSW